MPCIIDRNQRKSRLLLIPVLDLDTHLLRQAGSDSILAHDTRPRCQIRRGELSLTSPWHARGPTLGSCCITSEIEISRVHEDIDLVVEQVLDIRNLTGVVVRSFSEPVENLFRHHSPVLDC